MSAKSPTPQPPYEIPSFRKRRLITTGLLTITTLWFIYFYVDLVSATTLLTLPVIIAAPLIMVYIWYHEFTYYARVRKNNKLYKALYGHLQNHQHPESTDTPPM